MNSQCGNLITFVTRILREIDASLLKLFSRKIEWQNVIKFLHCHDDHVAF